MNQVNVNEIIEFYKIFKSHDEDNSGKLDKEEFKKIFKENQDLAEGTLISINSNRDDKIDIYEFLSFLLTKPSPFKGKKENQTPEMYIEKIIKRRTTYKLLINNSLENKKLRYINNLKLKDSNNFIYFQKVFSESSISNDYVSKNFTESRNRLLKQPRTPRTPRTQTQRSVRTPRRPTSSLVPLFTPPSTSSQTPRTPTRRSVRTSRRPTSSLLPLSSSQTPRAVKNKTYKEKMDRLREQYKSKLIEFNKVKKDNDFNYKLKKKLTTLCYNNEQSQNINLSTIPSLDKDNKKMLFLIYRIISINDIFMNNYLNKYLLEEKKEEIDVSIQKLCINIQKLIKNKEPNDFEKNFQEFCNELNKLLDLFKGLIFGVEEDLNKKILNELYYETSIRLSKYQKDLRMTSRSRGIINNDWEELDLLGKYNRLEKPYGLKKFDGLKKFVEENIESFENIQNEEIENLLKNIIDLNLLMRKDKRRLLGNMKKLFIIELLQKLKQIIYDRLNNGIVIPGDFKYLDKTKILKYLKNGS